MLIKNHLKSVKLFQGDTIFRPFLYAVFQVITSDLQHIYTPVTTAAVARGAARAVRRCGTTRRIVIPSFARR